ncbi:amidophosphoribosyltransferase [Heterostelium album PN500]|uniref:Amidophosphoribosyltransferase n=1 Tax=Heterostelium pallidum (strain ATCC 26659 / Pp 5 / PN500) TaxID=670386 RepID=D3BPT5_HETP5|nr:amidophosphoribosyltransferase [Heterostelium album PN500]EFA76218.1 amidophosphoribosyltransferase [Heterostelium album PN500]|eukprot:XP_020428351.1 amidophosphoribosyltransferase [Heterostelium album PN500]
MAKDDMELYLNGENENVCFDEDEMDEPKEKCGVFGIFAPELDVSRITFFAMVALQHRGQESCGIATYDSNYSVHVETGMGLVNQVFTETNLKPLKGRMAVGHTRYSTAGKSTINNAQPVIVQTLHGQVGIVQNGNLTTARSLRNELLQAGVGFFKDSDVEIITQLLAANPPGVQQPDSGNGSGANKANWESRISYFMSKAEGAYSLCLMTPNALYGVRDYLGLRPLCIGAIDVPSKDDPNVTIPRYVIASESCAINTIGGRYIREVRPGEIIKIDENGMDSFMGRKPADVSAHCVFEYVYFARPDSLLEDQLIHSVRQRMGEQLARESPPPTPNSPQDIETIVIGVPDSSLPAAIGYAKQSGLAYSEGLTKNRYIHRTFIQPTDHLRQQGIKLKFNPLTENIKGKRIVLIDDSIVRGNTIKALIKLIRSAGAVEIHVRISSPPVLHPCYMGIDMATHEQLIGYNKSLKEVCDYIGAESLQYLTYEGMMKAVQAGKKKTQSAPITIQTEQPSEPSQPITSPTLSADTNQSMQTCLNGTIKKSTDGYCSACFTADYPLAVDF